MTSPQQLLSLLCTILLLNAAPLFAADRTPAPLSPDQAVKAIKVPAGFTASLVAAEPDVTQPISYCFDDRGRLIVAEALNYGAWQPTGRDRIVILADRDGDGRVDERKIFYEGFNYITGVEVGFGGFWVISPPNLYFVPDRDHDDLPDEAPQILFDGFGHKESRHNLANGFTWGPDGWLYAGHGRTSPSLVGRPGTPSEDRILCDGGVYRIHPTRLVFENFADGTTNPWGVDFDDYGQCFVSNCVNPHLFHVVQGAHYEPWRNRPSSLYAYDRIATIADHLHYPSGQPKAMRGETQETLDMGGGHAHCGTLVYLGDRFPTSFRNSVFMCNVHGRRINNDVLRRNGSGYVATHGNDLMVAGDPWFMGVTLRTGPDGNVFVSDWSDTGECHTYQPDRGTGRIYKISFGQSAATTVDLAKQSDAELVEFQLHANDWYVRHARRLLQERAASQSWNGDAVHTALRRIFTEHQDVTRRLRALWALHVTGGLSIKERIALLSDSNEHVRAWAIQLLCEEHRPDSDLLAIFAKLAAGDSSPLVRLYLAAALQRLPLGDRWEIAAGLVTHDEDSNDLNLPLMYWYGIEPLAAADGPRFLKLANTATISRIREYIARRFVDQALVLDERGNLDGLVVALEQANAAGQRDLLVGARESLRGRKSMKLPSGWSATYLKLKDSSDPVVRASVTTLTVLFGDPAALADLRNQALSESRPLSDRLTALEALVSKGHPALAPDLHRLLADKDLRQMALRGLATVPHSQTAHQILNHYSELNSDEKTEAIATLASRTEFTLVLLDAMEKGKIPPGDVSAFAARQIYALNNPNITNRLRNIWGDVRDTLPQKQELIAKYKKQLTLPELQNADLRNGRLIYKQTCQQCHVLFGEGNKIGPDLTGSNRTNPEYLLNNIVDPGAEIGRDYRMNVVITDDGRILTGMILERTPARITVQTATDRVTLSADDVAEVNESKVSMMPEGQLEKLSREDVCDLFAYLGSPQQVPLPESSGKKSQSKLFE